MEKDFEHGKELERVTAVGDREICELRRKLDKMESGHETKMQELLKSHSQELCKLQLTQRSCQIPKKKLFSSQMS